MKYRIDFVTNSSSSSYIGVFAKISDIQKAKDVIDQYNLESFLVSGKRILADIEQLHFYGLGADWANVDLTPSYIDENADYILWESYGGAGDDDSYFWKNDYFEYDYDVDITDFDNIEQSIYNAISKENGFTDIKSGYGAGRDD